MAVLSTLSSAPSDYYDLEKAQNWHREHGSLPSLYQAIDEHNAALEHPGGCFILMDPPSSELELGSLQSGTTGSYCSSGVMDIDEESRYPSPPQHQPSLEAATSSSVSTSTNDELAASALLDLFGPPSSSSGPSSVDVDEQGTFLALSTPSDSSSSSLAIDQSPKSPKRKGLEELEFEVSKRARTDDSSIKPELHSMKQSPAITSPLKEISSSSMISFGLLTPPPSSPPIDEEADDDGLFEVHGSDGQVYPYVEILWALDESETYPGIPAIVIQEPNEADPNYALLQVGTNRTCLLVLPREQVEEERKAAFKLRNERERRKSREKEREKKWRKGKEGRKASASHVLWVH